MKEKKVAIIGTGYVGATAAYALFIDGTAYSARQTGADASRKLCKDNKRNY